VSDAVDRLGTEEVARRLGVKRETVYAYVSRGLLERHPASGPHDSQFDPAEVERLAARARRPDRSSALEVVVETELTLLDPAGRLSYRGRDAIELARFRSFEEVVTLLWDGAPPTPWELEKEVSFEVETVDAELIPLVVAMLAARDTRRDDRDPESVRRVGADVFAGVLAALGGDVGDSVAERLWVALAVDGAKARAERVKALDAALILLADHELAASTFAARVAASTWAGPYRVILAGLGPLGGALHGGAGATVEALFAEVAGGADPGDAVEARLAVGPLPGFGHRVYRDRDPRADHLLERLSPDPVAAAILAVAAERDVPAPNVDFALAALVHAHGLRAGSAATIFTVARIAGIVAHALEEYEHRLRFRPRASYVGPAPPSAP
jgi:citrate synthase